MNQRDKLLAILPQVKAVKGFVKLNYYTEMFVSLDPVEVVEKIRKHLTDPGSPSNRATSRFNWTFEEDTGTLCING